MSTCPYCQKKYKNAKSFSKHFKVCEIIHNTDEESEKCYYCGRERSDPVHHKGQTLEEITAKQTEEVTPIARNKLLTNVSL